MTANDSEAEFESVPKRLDEWIRADVAATTLGVSRRTVYRWVSEKGSGIVTRKPGGVLFISRKSLAAYIAKSDSSGPMAGLELGAGVE
jgi:excisionase family DNA binding protein